MIAAPQLVIPSWPRCGRGGLRDVAPSSLVGGCRRGQDQDTHLQRHRPPGASWGLLPRAFRKVGLFQASYKLYLHKEAFMTSHWVPRRAARWGGGRDTVPEGQGGSAGEGHTKGVAFGSLLELTPVRVTQGTIFWNRKSTGSFLRSAYKNL